MQGAHNVAYYIMFSQLRHLANYSTLWSGGNRSRFLPLFTLVCYPLLNSTQMIKYMISNMVCQNSCFHVTHYHKTGHESACFLQHFRYMCPYKLHRQMTISTSQLSKKLSFESVDYIYIAG